jgi:hypothetical protein
VNSTQTVTVKGTISTTGGPVRFASVTFIDNSDTTRKYSAITDTSGNYRIDGITSVKPGVQGSIPTKFELEQNYPNPFSSTTSISYKLAEQSNISVKIYNVLGQIVKEYRVGTQSAGIQRVEWDGRDKFGRKVSPGVYFYQLVTSNKSQAKKMLFGFGGCNGGQQLFSSINSPAKALSGKSCLSVQSKDFKVRIQDNGNTKPRILYTEIPSVSFHQDTTLNFQVDLGITAYSLCYIKLDTVRINGSLTGSWDLFLNDVTGMNCRNITNTKDEDESSPAWSPDGRYIAFRRDQLSGAAGIFLYDTANDTFIGLVTADSIDGDLPLWTPDSKKIVYDYHVIPHFNETHIINVDGTNDHKLEHTPAFFYPDSYSFLYVGDSEKVYKTNIDNSLNELVADLVPFAVSGIRGFNPETGEILFTANATTAWSDSTLKTYNIGTKGERVISVSDTGYGFSHAAWSEDFSKIAIIEAKIGYDSTHDYYLYVIENGVKRRLVHVSAYETPGGGRT